MKFYFVSGKLVIFEKKIKQIYKI